MTSEEFRRYGHQAIDVEHLTLALLRQEGGVVRSVLERLGASRDSIEAGLESYLSKQPRVSGASMDQYIAPRLKNILDLADKHSLVRIDLKPEQIRNLGFHRYQMKVYT